MPRRKPIALTLAALVTVCALLVPAAGAFASEGPLGNILPVSPEMPGAGPTLPADLYDRAGKVPTLDLWSPAGKPNELDKVKASKDYASSGWSAGFTHPLGGTRTLARQPDVEIKGRGNNTWCEADNGRSGKFCNVKIPLQVKFKDKVDLIGDDVTLTKKNDNANKTWILIANHTDASLMRNKLALDYAKSLGLPGTPEVRWVDLRMDGKYMGNYLLAEKVEVKSGRVDLKDPQGVIVELDNNYYYTEKFWFSAATSTSNFVLKDAKSDDKCDPGLMWTDAAYGCVPGNASVTAPTCAKKPAEDPAYAAQNAAEPNPAKRTYLKQNENCLPRTTLDAWNSAQTAINALDKELAKPSPDWASISSLIDVDSFLRFYFLADLVENAALVKSSIYFYKDGPADKLHAGPAWDFDTTVFNNASSESQGSNPLADYAKNTYMLRAKKPVRDEWGYFRPENPWYDQLYRNPEFMTLTNQLWSGTGAYVGQTPVRDLTGQVTGRMDEYWAQMMGNDKTALGSAANNFTKFAVLGTTHPLLARPYAATYGGEVAYLCTNLSQRIAFLGRDYGDIPLLRVQAKVAGETRPWVNNGQVAGTVIDGKQFETLSWDLNDSHGAPGWAGTGGITASAQLTNGKTVTVADTKNATLGTAGVGMAQWKMTATGELSQKYDLQYRAKLSSGWQAWRDAGAWAGSASGNRLEAVQVRLVLKNGAPTGARNCADFKALEATVRATAGPDQLFKDVSGATGGFGDINWLGATGIATGTAISAAAGNRLTEDFSPTAPASRETIAAWLFRYANPQGYAPPANSAYTDVSTTATTYPAISWAFESGLTGDTAGGQFRPAEGVARSKVASFLFRLAKGIGIVPEDYVPPTGASPFSDVGVSDAHYAAVRWLDANGIMGGSGRSWKPTTTITRGDLAVVIRRFARVVASSPIMPTTTPEPGQLFTDVRGSNAFFAEINWLGASGIATGVPLSAEAGNAMTTRFSPWTNVTREIMAAWLYRHAGSPPVELPATSPFLDLDAGNAYYKEIVWLSKQGITKGWEVPNGVEYRGSQPITRDAMAAFLYRYAGKPAFAPPATSPFADVATDNTFYPEITWLVSTGISTGWTVPNGKEYRPYSNITRDAMAAFLYRYHAQH